MTDTLLVRKYGPYKSVKSINIWWR